MDFIDPILDSSSSLETETNDDFDDDFEEEDDFDLEDGPTPSEDGDGYDAPKDFFTDKRRKKNLKKFLDVTVPQEILEGMPEATQLLFKKGKAE